MKCASLNHWMHEMAAGTLEAAKVRLLEEHLAGCPACRQEMAFYRAVFHDISRLPVPEPSAGLEQGFQRMLGGYREMLRNQQQTYAWKDRLIGDLQLFFGHRYTLRAAYTALILAVGLLAGRFYNPAGKELALVSGQLQEMREMMMLTLLQHPAATERIRAVSLSQDMAADRQVTDALLQTLNQDPNINVRLVALEALAARSADPRVREGLIKSIARQQSPLVQLALVDLMVALQEKHAVQELKGLLRQERLDKSVKGKIEQGLKTLI